MKETLEKLKGAETQAKDMIEKAKQDSEINLLNAKKEAENSIKKTEETLSEDKKNALVEAEKSVEKEVVKIEKDSEQEVRVLEDKAKSAKSEAEIAVADIILGM